MRKARKRVLSTLLAAVLALGLMPSFAFANEMTGCPGGDGCTHVAAIGDVHYGTLADAVNAAQNGDTIDLLRTTEGSGVKVLGDGNRTLTIDLHGFTYTVIDPTVGSPNTETNCFQLLKGSTVTFKNGTIKPGTGAAKILFQNYCNLTLDKVTVDCTGSNCQYVSSNNCGNVVIKDSKLIAAAGQAAFDVYYWPSNGYGDGVSVTVEGDSVITGRVEYGSDGTADGKQYIAEKASLNIKGGTFTGSLKTNNLGTDNKASINITGGTFQAADGSAWNVGAYVQPGMTQNSNGNIVIDTENAVAQIGSVGYTTLAAAVAAAEDNDTITMRKAYNATDEGTITLAADKDITLDLGGHTLTLSRFNLVQGWLTVENGSVKCDPTNGQAFNVYAGPNATDELYTKLVIEDDVTVNAAYGICLFPEPNSNAGYNSAIEVYGKIGSGGIFVSGNLGNDTTTAGNMVSSNKIPTITIHEGAVVSNGTEGQGIAMNGLANVTVEGGAVSGSEAIGVKRGTLTVNGGTFASNGKYVDPAEANNNGTENTGATISITSTYNYAGTIKVNLNGGTFTSKNAPAVYQGHSKNGDTTETYSQGVTLNIQGGTFTSKNAEVTPVFVADKETGDADTYTKQVVSGGTFSTEVQDYLANSIRYEVAHQTGNFSYAKTLGDAQTLAQQGDTIADLTATADNTVILTLDYNDGDATADSKYTVKSGTNITLPAPTRAGYTFKGWSDGANIYNAGASYKVTDDATLTAVWSANATPAPTPEQFDVAVADVQNGAVELSAKTAKEGQKVTVTVTPDLGWELAQLTVADVDGDALELTENADGTYSFTMPAGDVTVHASFADAWENPFTDVSDDDWFYGEVRTANLLGLMKGYDGTTLFGPDDGLMREQAATVMWNLMGDGDVSRPEAPQADVDQSQWYAPYVNWAVDSKVMDGYSEDDFGVGDSLTREQFAAVVAKAVGADVDSADQAALGAFPDSDGVSGWARATMAWAVEAGVLNGVETEDGSRELQATRELTRAEMATMMVNAIEVGVLDFGA